jgi:hypothetical protein
VIRHRNTLPKWIADTSKISPQNPIIHRANPILQLALVKPTLQVTFGIWNVLRPTPDRDVAVPSGHRLLALTVTNMGPGVVVLYACIGRSKAHWWTRPEFGTINPIHGDVTTQQPISIGPFSAGLPTKIDAGDVTTFYFPYAEECLLRDGIVRVGITDTYQRNTWCRRRDMKKVNTAYRRDFG